MIEFELGRGRAFFSTRRGGVSEGPFESLNLGILTDDLRDRVGENRRRFAELAGIDCDHVASARQVHGTEICEWDGPPAESFATATPRQVQADGHITASPGVGLVVLAADCVPVAVVGSARAAMLHCGWRGLADGIIERALASFDDFEAAIGPGIGPCCYQVGPEVTARFADVPGATSGRMLDLKAVIAHKLNVCGARRIEEVSLCTSCRADLFFSHRRDGGITGRQGGMVWLT